MKMSEYNFGFYWTSVKINICFELLGGFSIVGNWIFRNYVSVFDLPKPVPGFTRFSVPWIGQVLGSKSAPRIGYSVPVPEPSIRFEIYPKFSSSDTRGGKTVKLK